MEDKIKFPANVILIDVAFLNEVVYGAKNFLEGKLGRKLPDVDLPAWLSYLALDAGLREQENEVEVLLVHTPAADVLKCCEPSDVNKTESPGMPYAAGRICIFFRHLFRFSLYRSVVS